MALDSHKLTKIVAATSVICRRRGGSVDIFPLVKVLYLADRELLKDCHRPLTGDSYCSMAKGPVVSGVYDLVKGDYNDRLLQAEWRKNFSRTQNTITPISAIDESVLSELEVSVLGKYTDFVRRISPRELEDYLHALPEYENPGKSSKPIPLQKLLAKVLEVSAEEAVALEKEIEYSFGVRSKVSP